MTTNSVWKNRPDGKTVRRKERAGKSPRHVRLYHWLLKSAAWQSLSANARATYVEMAARYDGTNNGEIPYSCREAVASLHVGQTTAVRALRELQERGFIAVTRQGAFSLKTRHSTKWLLTEFPRAGSLAIEGSKEFMRWQPPEEKKPAPKIQNTGPIEYPSGPIEYPNGSCGGTVVAEMSRDGSYVGPVRPLFPDPRVLHRSSNSIPGSLPASGPRYETSPDLMTEHHGVGHRRYELSTGRAKLQWSTPTIPEVTDPVEAAALRKACGE
jgi:hypothetical protein